MEQLQLRAQPALGQQLMLQQAPLVQLLTAEAVTTVTVTEVKQQAVYQVV